MSEYLNQYLTFVAKEAGTFTFTYGISVPAALHTSISYSLDGQNWVTAYNADSQEVTLTTPTIPAGGKVYWKGTGYGMTQARSANNYCNFTSTGQFDTEGNIMSLLYGDDNFPGHLAFERLTGTTTNYNDVPVFYYLFARNNNIISAKDLQLPATTIVNRCYQEMFYMCKNLVYGPEILPATQLSFSCYVNMFYSCSSLVKGPVLPAETLVIQCYYQMFRQCTSLTYIKAMFTNSLSTVQALTNWVNGVDGTGTFVKNINATWENTYGASAIPTNFVAIIELQVVQDSRRRMMMDEKYSDKWREWITIRSRNRTNMSTNICATTVVGKISRMIIDDVMEVTPVAKYEFPDGYYHTVRLLLKNPLYLESEFFYVTNGTINYCRLPFSLTSMGKYGMRYLGASQTCYVILKNPVPPTGSNASTGMTVAQVYVPDESLDAYKTQFSNLGTRVRAMSTYTQRYY